MKYKKSIVILTMIFVLVFSIGVFAGPQDKIENMNFKNTAVVDVLRAIAEVADVNLITDSNVSGTITVDLKDITFTKALDLITQTRALSYEWDGNTVVVAAPERLDSIYADIITEFVEVKSADFDNIGTITKDIFPETQITLDSARRQFILKGEKEIVKEIKEMINRLDSVQTVAEIEAQKEKEKAVEEAKKEQEQEIVVYTESYNVLNAELSDLEQKLRTILPGVNIQTNQLTNTMTLSGEEQKVKEALSMAKTYDNSLEPDTRNIRVDYVDIEQITEIVGKFYPNVKLHLNNKRKEVIVNGAKNKLDGVEELIKEINRPQDQVIIEVRVEEVSTDKLKELGVDLQNGTLSRLHFIKDQPDPSVSNADGGTFGQIEGIELTWPNFLRAINDDSNSKTLANPRLMTLNGEEANMSITDEVPYPVYDDEGNQSFDYMQAGIDLTFTPWITENNEIELSMTPEVSSFGPKPEGATLPPKKTRTVTTRLRLKDGETFAIGGLIQEDEQESMSKVPLLGDIPIIGEIFKSRSSDRSRSELLIFVTPRIIEYGEEYAQENHLINSGLNHKEKMPVENSKSEKQKGTKIVSNKTEAEIIADYLQKRSKNREEILDNLREGKEQKEKEYQELSPEELKEILNK